MSLFALSLVLAAAFAHAAWNIIAHGSSRAGLPFLWWGAVCSAMIWAGVIPFTGGLGTASWGALALGILVSSVLHVAYMLVLQRGYARGDLSTVYATARGSGPLITVLWAVLVWGERPGPAALVGVLVLVAGVVAFGLIGNGGRRGSGVRNPLRDPALGYGVLTGVAIAAYTLWDAHVVTAWGIAPVAFMVGCTLGEIPLLTALLMRRGVRSGVRRLREVLRESWGKLLAFGVLSPLSYVLVLTAVTLAPVSLVAPIREASVVIVGLYGVWRSRESRPALRILAAVTVVLGVSLVGL